MKEWTELWAQAADKHAGLFLFCFVLFCFFVLFCSGVFLFCSVLFCSVVFSVSVLSWGFLLLFVWLVGWLVFCLLLVFVLFVFFCLFVVVFCLFGLFFCVFFFFFWGGGGVLLLLLLNVQLHTSCFSGMDLLWPSRMVPR